MYCSFVATEPQSAAEEIARSAQNAKFATTTAHQLKDLLYETAFNPAQQENFGVEVRNLDPGEKEGVGRFDYTMHAIAAHIAGGYPFYLSAAEQDGKGIAFPEIGAAFSEVCMQQKTSTPPDVTGMLGLGFERAQRVNVKLEACPTQEEAITECLKVHSYALMYEALYRIQNPEADLPKTRYKMLTELQFPDITASQFVPQNSR